MCHGAHRGNTVHLVGKGAGSAHAAADVGSLGTVHRTADALCAAGTKLHHSAAIGSAADAVRLGGDQTLVVKAQQDKGFDQLCFDCLGADGDHRLAGENGGAVGNGVNIAGKAEVLQILQKFLRENTASTEVRNILFVKMQILNVIDDLIKTCGNGKTALVGNAAEEGIKVGDTILVAVAEVAIAHRQLIKIAEHTQVHLFLGLHDKFLFFCPPHFVQQRYFSSLLSVKPLRYTIVYCICPLNAIFLSDFPLRLTSPAKATMMSTEKMSGMNGIPG